MSTNNKSVVMFSNKTYDRLRFAVQVAIPATGTLYFAIAEIWGLMYGAQVTASATALAAFLGTILTMSRKVYSNTEGAPVGTMLVNRDEEGELKGYTLDVGEQDPYSLVDRDEVKFLVREQDSQ